MKSRPEEPEAKATDPRDGAEQERDEHEDAGAFCGDPLCPCGDDAVWAGVCDDDFDFSVGLRQPLPEGPEIDRVPHLIATRQGLILVGHFSTSARGH